MMYASWLMLRSTSLPKVVIVRRKKEKRKREPEEETTNYEMEEDMDENTADYMESDGDYAELKKKQCVKLLAYAFQSACVIKRQFKRKFIYPRRLQYHLMSIHILHKGLNPWRTNCFVLKRKWKKEVPAN